MRKSDVDKHCENMRPGSSIPHTPEFAAAWEIRVSFEAGYDKGRQDGAKKIRENIIRILERSMFFRTAADYLKQILISSARDGENSGRL
jgi:hypothetical protein